MQNLKKHNVSLKLNSAEFSELERICTTLGFSKADYLRAVAFGAPAPGATPAQAAETAPAPDLALLQADIAALKTQQEEMNAAQAQAAESFNTLLDYLNQYIRVPSFREYRTRDIVEGTIQKAGENELSFLTRLATRYYLIYKAWPNPAESTAFGPAAEETKANFPKAPRI